jgi:hypothetical protein
MNFDFAGSNGEEKNWSIAKEYVTISTGVASARPASVMGGAVRCSSVIMTNGGLGGGGELSAVAPIPE